ncbi:ACT domain-containing protein [Pyrobaculum sp.]|uniref:Acetolactate synthase small subunit n=1 Tax=Pyrobaculum oguniense (strain DSM 13380 / JCM 10595 / TE7) TaxID=698757 RepID=H6Q740_PYROT|nr:acetolactate synthase small subunit [Pyrobaculum oguniense TE7]
MWRISAILPKSLDGLGRLVAITRRAKVEVLKMTVTTNDMRTYNVVLEIRGEPDEVNWLVAKLDKLPEILSIEQINIGP